jgi:diguanylate cyclase (GGDEF)-like protein
MVENLGSSMPQMPGRELAAAIGQLDQAIRAHEQWYKNLVRMLVARLPPEDADQRPDAHHRCRFGQWYDSDLVEPWRDEPAFLALGRAHERMHISAAHLLKCVEDDLPTSASDLDRFDNDLDQVHLELESLRGILVDRLQTQDPLTEVRNRANMLADLREQHALVRRVLGECALVMIDIDHFKEVNDTHGHPAGDRVLRTVAQRVQGGLRPYDRLYRYGGDEFLVCAPQLAIALAVELAERLRRLVGEQPIPPETKGALIQVTASIGVAQLDGDGSVEEAIQHADEAMYCAKQAGRNRVEVFVATTNDRS